MSARRAPGVAVVVAAVTLTACGGGSSGLSAVEQSQLTGLIGQARSSAAAGDPARAQTALTELRSTVSQWRRAGLLTPAAAARMQSVAAQAQSEVRAQTSAASQPAPTAPVARPASPATPTPAPTPPANPAQIVIQGAGSVRTRVGQAVGQGVAKLKDKIAKLEQRFTGPGGGEGPGQGKGGGH